MHERDRRRGEAARRDDFFPPSFLSSSLSFTLILVIATLVSCAFPENAGTPGVPSVQDIGSITAHFCPVEDCERILLRELRNAADISCVFYDLDLENVTALLVEKNARVKIFAKNAAGLPNSFTRVGSRGLMHDKFCVLDPDISGKARVITGSMNPTRNGAYKNDNNLFIVTSAVIAQNYLEEWEEIGGSREAPTVNRIVNLTLVEPPAVMDEQNMTADNFADGFDDGFDEGFDEEARGRAVIVENYFCPEDDCEEMVLRELSRSREKILFMTFTFTSDTISAMLRDKMQVGVNVSGVFEARQRSQHWEYDRLAAAGADVLLDGNPQTMHHKVFIIDPDLPSDSVTRNGAAVILGSFNPTAAASEKNDENILIVHDQSLAQAFVAEFERVRGEGHK